MNSGPKHQSGPEGLGTRMFASVASLCLFVIYPGYLLATHYGLDLLLVGALVPKLGSVIKVQMALAPVLVIMSIACGVLVMRRSYKAAPLLLLLWFVGLVDYGWEALWAVSHGESLQRVISGTWNNPQRWQGGLWMSVLALFTLKWLFRLRPGAQSSASTATKARVALGESLRLASGVVKGGEQRAALKAWWNGKWDLIKRRQVETVLIVAATVGASWWAYGTFHLPYDVVDSGITSNGQDLVAWSDEETVWILSYGGPAAEYDGHYDFEKKAVYRWKIGERPKRYAETYSFCVDGDYISYKLTPKQAHMPPDPKIQYRMEGTIGQESLRKISEAESGDVGAHVQKWFSKFACRDVPVPELQGKEIAIPLRPEHGVIVYDPIAEDRNPERTARLIKADGSAVSLRISDRELKRYDVRAYYPFKDAYVIDGKYSSTKNCFVQWYLRPEGRLELECAPELEKGETLRGVYPTVKGLVMVVKGAELGQADIYLVHDGNERQKLITGFAEYIAVSPSGCRIAFNRERRNDSIQRHQATVHVIDLCE